MEKEETIKVNLGALKKIPFHGWAIFSYLLIILVIILLLVSFPMKALTGKAISENDIKPMIEKFINTFLIPEGGAVVNNIKEVSGIYVATVTIQGQSVPTYFTKDGKFITQGTVLFPIDKPVPSLDQFYGDNLDNLNNTENTTN